MRPRLSIHLGRPPVNVRFLTLILIPFFGLGIFARLAVHEGPKVLAGLAISVPALLSSMRI